VRRSKDQFVQDSSRSPIPISYGSGKEKKSFVDITSGDKFARMFARSFLFSSFITREVKQVREFLSLYVNCFRFFYRYYGDEETVKLRRFN